MTETVADQPNPPPQECSESPKPSERETWIIRNVLLPLENNFGKYYNPQSVKFFCAQLAGWQDADLLKTVEFIIRDRKFLPAMKDFHDLRPRQPEPDYSGPPAAIAEIPTQPGSWGDFIVRTCGRFLKTKNLVGMYEALIAEAERRKMPEDEYHHGKNVGINGLREALRLAQVAATVRKNRTVAGAAT